jgi:predicted molibdopterin-dependent oxidoreductase YjgC
MRVIHDLFIAETALYADIVLPGTVISQGLWWDGKGTRQRVNALMPDRLSDMDGGITFFSEMVVAKKQEQAAISPGSV